MFQVVSQWNLLNTNNIITDNVPSEIYRGYDLNTFLPGEWLSPIKIGELNKLSVSDIADKKCPTRRDLYYKKGKNKPRTVHQNDTWGGRAGPLVEKYFVDYLSHSFNLTDEKYRSIIDNANRFHKEFLLRKRRDFTRLEQLESGDFINTEWLKILLNCGGRSELGLKVLHSLMEENNSFNATQIQTRIDLTPNIEIGINSPSNPDFIIPDHGIVGDIKSGPNFLGSHQLTCAGYAFAYENQMKNEPDKKTIDWGIIYFFATRNPSAHVRPITYPQLYVFPIDDILRNWFLDTRDEAYKIISRAEPPDFPTNNFEKCQFCRYFEYCQTIGLE